jgi:hypothetical protein
MLGSEVEMGQDLGQMMYALFDIDESQLVFILSALFCKSYLNSFRTLLMNLLIGSMK